MVSIQIQQGQGIAQALKAQFASQGIDTSNLNWNSIMTEVSKENDDNKKNNKTVLYSGGSDIKGSTKSNFVVNPNQKLELSDSVWNNIVNVAKTQKVDKTQTSQTSFNAGKVLAQKDLNGFKQMGATEKWTSKNTCEVTYQGHKITVTIDSNTGLSSLGGSQEDQAAVLEPYAQAATDDDTNAKNFLSAHPQATEKQ